MDSCKIISMKCWDIRFPTSLTLHGSDAMHPNPDYSSAYVVIGTSGPLNGYGLTFTIGHGTEIVVKAVEALSPIVIGCYAKDIFSNFAHFWRKLTSDPQLRWLGPEKGAIHLATAAICNALWDLWARLEGKPVWKLLADMDSELLASTVDFRYVTDAVTKEEAIKIFKSGLTGMEMREEEMKKSGYWAYTTQVGWIGFSDEKIESLCQEYLKRGFGAFKVKVGRNLEEDKRRCRLIRRVIGEENYLMMDANQIWEIDEAKRWMKELAEFKPLWIEEPTSPDDILGHAEIAKYLRPFGIGVATGEVCCNRIMFKQFLQAGALDYCQIDCGRLGSINEILAVYLMARKFNVPVCPHAGGVGLCEMVQHLQIFDYLRVSKHRRSDQFIEHVDQVGSYFETAVEIKGGRYVAPMEPGYGTKFKEAILEKFEYPGGSEWLNIASKKAEFKN